MSDYTVLVVDPPWSYGSKTTRAGTAEHHYDTLGNAGKEINRKSGAGIQSIIDATPVPAFAAKESHLYLWTTNPKLPFTFDVMRAWGFEYKTTLTWVKTKAGGSVNGGGMGWFFRGATEHILFGTKGGKGIPAALRKPNVIMAPTGEHSEKPAAFYDLLRGIYGDDERMVDMYARKSHPRFTAWGDEAPESIPEPSNEPNRIYVDLCERGRTDGLRSTPAEADDAVQVGADAAAGRVDGGPGLASLSDSPSSGE